jgi:hypothetical protein
MRWCSQRATEVGRKFGVLTRPMGSEGLPCPIAGDARIWASRVHLRTASHGSRAGSRWQTESSPTTGTPIIRLVLSGSTHFSYTRPGFYYGGLVERESLCFGLIQFFQHIYLFTHFPGVPTPSRIWEHPRNKAVHCSRFNFPNRTISKPVDNEAIRPNRIDQHAPGSFTGNLERRNRGDVAGIDIGGQAIHMIIEYTIPKKMR